MVVNNSYYFTVRDTIHGPYVGTIYMLGVWSVEVKKPSVFVLLFGDIRFINIVLVLFYVSCLLLYYDIPLVYLPPKTFYVSSSST